MIFPGSADGRVELDLDRVPFDQALRRSAEHADVPLIEEGQLVRWPPGTQPRDQAATGPRRAVELPDGRALEVTLEGVVLVGPGSDDRDACLLSGRIHLEGDHLVDDAGEETPVRVLALEDDHLVLQLLPSGEEVVLPYPR